MTSKLIGHSLDKSFVLRPEDLRQYFDGLGVKVFVLLGHLEVVLDVTEASAPDLSGVLLPVLLQLQDRVLQLQVLLGARCKLLLQY